MTLTITTDGDEASSYIEISGTKYWTAQTIELDAGAEVYCRAYISASGTGGIVVVNNETVASAGTSQYANYAEYTYIVQANISVALGYDTRTGGYVAIAES